MRIDSLETARPIAGGFLNAALTRGVLRTVVTEDFD